MAGRRFALEVSPDRVEAWVRGDGLVLEEPALVAREAGSGRLAGFGAQAVRAAGGRTDLTLVAPFGIADLEDQAAAEQMLRQVITRIVGRLVFVRHELVLAVPAELSTSARRSLLEVGLGSGARMTHLLDLPLAMAFGAGLPVTSWEPLPVLFLLPQGAQAAVVCHQGLLSHGAVELPALRGGDDPGPLGGADGPELVSRLVSEVLAEAPPSAQPGLRRAGLAVAGRGLPLIAISEAVGQRCQLPSRVVADPEHCVVKGAEVALERIQAGGRTLLYLR